MALARAHVVVSGDVQGVGFRYAAQRTAKSHNLTGWVKNLPNGSVEAVFEGERGAIEQMLQWCHRGPSAAEVTNVSVQWEQPTGDFHDFRIAF